MVGWTGGSGSGGGGGGGNDDKRKTAAVNGGSSAKGAGATGNGASVSVAPKDAKGASGSAASGAAPRAGAPSASKAAAPPVVVAADKIGLRNLGATCYVNCLLQTLFHNLRFRQSIYDWRRPAAQVVAAMKPEVVRQLDALEAMQSLFARMHISIQRSVAPTALVELLGVSKTVQQDVQEFNKLMLAFIDNALSKTSQAHQSRWIVVVVLLVVVVVVVVWWWRRWRRRWWRW